MRRRSGNKRPAHRGETTMEIRHWGAMLAAIALAFVSFGLGAYCGSTAAPDGVPFKEWLPLLSTIASGSGTALALAIAYQANKISRDSAEAQLRPHIYISNSKFYQVDKEIYIGCEFTNSGISPAIDVQIDFQFLIGPLDSSVRDEDMVRFTTAGSIAPGAKATVDRPMKLFTPENVASIRNGEMGVFMRSIVSYSWANAAGKRDGFDVTHLCDGDYLDRGVFRQVRR